MSELRQHPGYHEGFYDAADFTPLYDDATAPYKAGWQAYWECRAIMEAIVRGDQVKFIREKISQAIGQRVSQADLGAALQLAPANAGDTVRSWEDGSKVVSGPAATALELMAYCIDIDETQYLKAIFSREAPPRK